MWPGLRLTHHQLKAVFSRLSADTGKKLISGGREKETVKDERECQSAKINRWIKTNADVSLFTIPLLCIHLLPLPLSTLSSSDAARKTEKMLTNSRLGNSASLFAFHPRRGRRKKKDPLAALLKHFVSPTLSKTLAPRVIQSVVFLTLSWGTFWPRNSVPPFPVVSSSNFLFLTCLVLPHAELFCFHECVLQFYPFF